MSFTQLNPQIPFITEKGKGQAVGVIDYSEEHDLMWVIILDDSGEVWVMPNAKVRGFPNYTSGRNFVPNMKENKDEI